MAHILPKLNLNKTPSLVEDNSLVFAKNIRLDVDGTIHRDYGVFPLSIVTDKDSLSYINYQNLLNRIVADAKAELDANADEADKYSWLQDMYGKLNTLATLSTSKYQVVGIIADSNDFYVFIHGVYTRTDEGYITADFIIKYSEKEDKFLPCNCAWTWSGGTINGCVINNLVGDSLLNIGETGTANLVPFKSINLNKSSYLDDESIYTQIPRVPVTNLNYAGDFSYVIPNGVYQFFVRYKIRKDFYTDWFPASSEIFVGNKNTVITSFGSLAYTNIHRDSDNSIVLDVEHLVPSNEQNYESFQVGFIVSHDDTQYARAWKHFSFDVKNINFDYKAEDAEEIEPTEILKTTYGLYNVGNITSFKNKLYISNYTESEFNDNSLQQYADSIDITLSKKEGGNTYGDNPIIETTISGKPAISGLVINGAEKRFTGSDGLFHDICNVRVDDTRPTIEEAITKCLNNETNINAIYADLHWIRVSPSIEDLEAAKDKLKSYYKDIVNSDYKKTYSVKFPSNDIVNITINGKAATSADVIPAIYNTERFLNTDCKFIDTLGSINDTVKVVIERNAIITETSTYYNDGGFDSTGGDDSLTGDGNLSRPSDGNGPISGGSGNGSGSGSTSTRTINATYTQTIEIQFIAWKSKYEFNSATYLTHNTTLIPYQKYKFYIHFVKSTGEITNGFYCSKAGELEAPYMEKCNSVIYPVFSNIQIPEGYVACFFSISHTKTTTATVFNIEDAPDGTSKESSCFDINMLLMPAHKNIHIKQGDVETYSGQYYMSSDSSVSRYFGADGVVTFDGASIDNKKLAYAITDYGIAEAENIELIKCTPYISVENVLTNGDVKYYDDYAKMNLLGFICSVTPLLRATCIKYYSDGSSIFYKDATANNLQLTELSKYNDELNADKKLANFSLKVSDNEFVYSNYNLNYVTLSEEPKLSIKTYYDRPANADGQATESQSSSGNSILLRLISSQLMSDIYALPSMYKSYLRKTYSLYNDSDTTVFNNTVRSSKLYGDENRVNLLAFDANDYYNIPTNRGIIVNLAAVGDAILVHTKDSMFKFVGSNTLQSSDGEIQTTENQPFNTGVTELFGSDFGFAGLQVKTDSIITENGYIFFDRDSRIIYMYGGQGQIAKLSDSIEKLFRHRDIKNLYFANDFYNNRIFISIMFYENYVDGSEVKERLYPVTLSFNVHEQIKAFVSLHDFYYHKAFNTKTRCYFLTGDIQDICTINKKHKAAYTKLEIVSDNLFPCRKEMTTIKARPYYSDTEVDYNIALYDSIVDVIDNTAFETIKTLNAVNWCGNVIESEYEDINADDVATLRMAEDINNKFPCKYLRVYSDTCMTPLNDFRKISNEYAITSADSYKYPRYNQGVWTFNYFRNILNSKGNQTKYVSDENSLIEGKYFVVRFVFDSEFKLETLSLNYNGK